jgi:general secretion pathway protein G
MHTLTPSNVTRRAARAFTLIEMIVVVIIIGVLAAAIGPALFKRVGGAKQGVAANNAASIAAALNMYQADNGSLPESGNLSVLCARPSSPDSKGPWLDNCDMLKDPWGRNFVVIIPGQKNANFDVVSYGADGKPGGTGEDADIIKP